MPQQDFRIPLGHVTAPSGTLLLVDVGMLNFWKHDAAPLVPEGAIGDPDVEHLINSAVDFRIDGPDAEAAGRAFAFQWHPRYIYDIPTTAIADIRDRFSTLVKTHQFDAQLVQLDERVSHSQRVEHALAVGSGMGEVPYHGMYAVGVSGLPHDTPMKIYGLRMESEEFADRWRWVYLDIHPERQVKRTDTVGYVTVDRARLMFADIEALKHWEHEASLDGKADFVFWGIDASKAAAYAKAPHLNDEFGWRDLPIDEAVERGMAVARDRQDRGLKFVTDFRPHSHHYLLMEQLRSSPTESGTLEVGDAAVCGFMTTWGDGAFPIIRDVDAEGVTVRVWIDLGNDTMVQNTRTLMQR